MQNRLETVLTRIKPGDRVLDIGAWNKVLPRADVVIDLNPYETRTIQFPEEKERFTRETWIQGDVHSRELWARFGDKEFEFVICSHLLEDIRDPLFVCEQVNRVAKAGYIECPSRFRECARNQASDSHAGYDHHRWIVDVIDNGVVFTAKLGWAHAIDYLGDHRRAYLSAFEHQFVALFWEGSFNYYERFPKGNLIEGANLLHFYDTYEYGTTPFVFEVRDGLARARVKPGTCLWVTEFLCPVERDPEMLKRYLARCESLLAGVPAGTPSHSTRLPLRYRVVDWLYFRLMRRRVLSWILRLGARLVRQALRLRDGRLT